jgi:hypothetical protein
MRVGVTIAADGPERWRVTFAGVALAPRTLPRAGPPLWVGPEDGPLADIAQRIHEDGEVEPGDGEAFGRHLFGALLGAEGWQAIADAAGGARVIELALHAGAEAAPLHGLAWELLHDGQDFLAIRRDPPVTVTRIIDSPAEPRPIASPARVLFAIGSALDDPVIRPGAEFMGLLRRLEAVGAAINARVVEAADLTTLARAAARFRPDVVHVIAHGAPGAEPAINLPEGPGEARHRRVTAAQLLAALNDQGSLPAIVVLSACTTGNAVGGKAARSFAAALVAGGVPVVVAMAGRVTDQACRCFTRRFGQMLTASEPLVAAVAQGRRAAFYEGDPPDRSVDWALPALFAATAVGHDHVPVTPAQGLDVGQLLHDLTLKAEPVFCGRREFIDAYDELMSGSRRSVLLIESDGRDGLGRRRLLKELGAIALRDGHLPLLAMPPRAAAPRSLRAFGAALLERVIDARRRLKLPEDRGSVLLKVLGGAEAAALADERDRGIAVAAFLAGQAEDPAELDARTLREAIGWDLEALAHALRGSELPTRHEGSRPLVLLGGVESWGGAIVPLLTGMLDQDGLGRPGGERVPVIVTCRPAEVGEEVLKPLRESSTGLDTWARVMKLDAFTEREDVIAYPWVLMNPRPALGLPYANQAYVVRGDTDWHRRLREITGGLPGGMNQIAFYVIADMLLEKAEDDEQRLAAYLEQQR